ncbi:MAG: glutathione-disulfide reductase [Alphaproteobacteria bacterium GM7ARS4]|nr:glutathione-disulfide reductase [Alphaproteobacteria bacterium GM7ARS4]
MTYDYDLYVIGAGSGGVRLARKMAHKGMRVAIAEQDAFGGTCVNKGCVPKKLLSYASIEASRHIVAQSYGVCSESPRVAWETLRDAVNKEVQRLNGLYRQLLITHSVDIHQGHAHLTSPHHVRITQQQEQQQTTYTSKHIVIATGSFPYKPPIDGIDHAYTSDDMFTLPTLPQRIAIIGGGYIAVEFACILCGLGVDVVLIHRGPRILSAFDEALGTALSHAMRLKSIDVLCSSSVTQIKKQGKGYQLKRIHAPDTHVDAVLCATGRLPLTQDLGLEDVGVRTNDKGAILVNDMYQSAVPSIYAIGDCIDHMNLTPVAIAQAERLVSHFTQSAQQSNAIDYDAIPTAVFSTPPIATIGLSEQQAHARQKPIRTCTQRYTPLKYSLTAKSDVHTSLIKAIINSDDHNIIGLHMIGLDAPEIMQGFAVAFRMGMTLNDLHRTIGIHPTSAEEWVTLDKP